MFYKILFAAAVIALAPSLREGGGGLLFAQQDPQYSQYMFNQLALNPAYAGSRDKISSALLYRNQWTGIAGAPRMATLSFQMPIQKKKIGAAAEIISDHLGPKSVNALLLSYAYRVTLGKGRLSLGLRLGAYNYVYDMAKIEYKDKSDLYNTGLRESKLAGTGDLGFYYHTRTFYWGLGINHLNRSKIIVMSQDTFSRKALHIFMPVSKAFQAGNTVLNPTLLIKRAGNSPGEIDLGINVLLKEKVWLGVSARSGYGFVFLAQFLATDQLKVGYSYDYGINRIGVAGKGSHEIMIGYDLDMRGSKMLMPRYL